MTGGQGTDHLCYRCGLPGVLPLHGHDGRGEELGGADEEL